MKQYLYLLSILLAAISCSSSGYKNADSSVASTQAEYSEYTDNEAYATDGSSKTDVIAPNAPVVETKIIKTADVEIEVKDFEEGRKALQQIINKHNALIVNESEANYNYRRSSSITIRLQPELFDTILYQITELAKFVNTKNIHSTDVTDQFVDIEARLKTKRQTLDQYKEVLSKATNVSDILNVSEHLRVLQEEIETQEGRLKYLSDQVARSTITLTIYQNNDTSYSPSFLDKIIDGFAGGWEGLLTFIIGLIYLWPFLIILAVVIWLVRKYIKNKKNR